MIADEITIECGPMRLDPQDAREVELLLGVVADLRIIVRGQVWSSEPEFPVVELSQAIARWLAVGGDFEFETMEAEEVPVLWVRAGGAGCVLGGAWQNFSIDPPLSCESVRGALRRFAENVVSSTKGAAPCRRRETRRFAHWLTRCCSGRSLSGCAAGHPSR